VGGSDVTGRRSTAAIRQWLDHYEKHGDSNNSALYKLAKKLWEEGDTYDTAHMSALSRKRAAKVVSTDSVDGDAPLEFMTVTELLIEYEKTTDNPVRLHALLSLSLSLSSLMHTWTCLL
jgi:hypothetical protein